MQMGQARMTNAVGEGYRWSIAFAVGYCGG
jgi:hypothetical protein